MTLLMRCRALAVSSVLVILSACGGTNTGTPSNQSVSGALPPAASSTPQPCQCLYVANTRSNSLTFYHLDATGNATLSNTIAGPSTNLSEPFKVTGDAAGNIFAGDSMGQIVHFLPGAHDNAIGDVLHIEGPGASLRGFAFDDAGNLYEAKDNEIPIFAKSLDGHLAFERNIVGPKTGLSSPDDVALDAAGTIYVANAGSGACGPQGSVTVYPAGVYGFVYGGPPIQSIGGSKTGIAAPVNVAVDANRRIYVHNLHSGIEIFAAGANGNIAPIATIATPESVGLAVDANGNIYTSVSSQNAIYVYPPVGQLRADGHTLPTHIVAGSNSGLDFPQLLTVH